MTSNRQSLIRRIAQDTLERPPSERRRYLAEACGADEQLRREVEAMLSHDLSAEHSFTTAAVDIEAQQIRADMLSNRWRRMTGVFHDALSRAAAERQAFLNEACAGDEALRHEVAAMLAAHESAGEADIPAFALSEEMPRVQSGSALGPYRIHTLIGSGGMGQVYRAHDERIGRDVAVKLLPAGCTADADRLRRFEQEARVSGALNHPNVLSLYDVGRFDDRPYLVMELLDGETLRDRVGRGATPPLKACDIAAAIARGLAAAHAKGIVHRDLKPENVMLTRDGRVKILDFGIAKLRNPGPDLEAQTVGTPQLTAANTILGTAGYMSPEQIRGEHVDARTDLFALGAILFELLTGRRAFDRASRRETLNATLHDDVALPSSVSPHVTPAVERIVQRCLEKQPDARFQSASDLAFALETTTGISTSSPTATTAVRRAFGVRSLAAVTIVVVTVTAAVLWRFRAPAATASPQLARFLLSPPPGLRFLGPPAISPDGALIVFPAGEGPVEKERLFVRRLDQITATALPGTEGGTLPFFSPDGRSIGFWADNTLKTTNVDGATTPNVVCGVELPLGGTWTTDGAIIFGSINHGLQRVPAVGGSPQPLTAPDRSKSEIDHRAPKALPGGQGLLMTVHEGGDRFRIDVLTLPGGARRTLVPAGFDPAFTPTGHLVYGYGSSLFDVPFDLDRLEVTGPALKLLDNVMTAPDSGVAGFAMSTNGTMVIRTKPLFPRRMLVWADRSGAATPLPLEPRTYWTPRLSPDGRRFVVVVEEQGRRDLWVYRFDTGVFGPVTFEGLNRAPVWTSDGSRLVYLSERNGLRHLMWQPADATAPAHSLLSSENDDFLPGGWSADGRSILYIDRPPTDNTEFHVLPMTERHSIRLSGIPARSNWPALSPDGRWLAFVTCASCLGGRPDIYVGPFPGPGQYRRLVGGAGQPVWSRNGDVLYFRSRRGAPPGAVPGEGIFELPFDRTQGIAAGPERQLFRKHFPEDSPWWGAPGFDVAPDGRFLVVIADDTESFGGVMNILLHVDDELRRRAR